MEFFAKLMSMIGLRYSGIDIVASLPVEVAELILSNLDSQSLLNAARVSSKWLAVCNGSPRLRNTGRNHLRMQKLRMIQYDIMPDKLSRSQIVSRTTRMQTDMFRGISHHESVAVSRHLAFVIHPVTKTARLNKPSSRKIPPSAIPTRCTLRLR